jgi:hypothetical protein
MRKLKFLLLLLLICSLSATCQVKLGIGLWFGGTYPKYGVSVNWRVNDKLILEPIFSFGVGQHKEDLRWGLRAKYDLGQQGNTYRYLGVGLGLARGWDLWEQKQELGLSAFVGVSNPGSHFTSSIDLGPSMARIRYLPYDDGEIEDYYSGGMKFNFGYHYNFHQVP